MSNWKKIVGISIGSILVITLISYAIISNSEDKPYNQVNISYNNSILNSSLPSYYDTVLYVGLDALGAEGVTITVDKLSDKAKEQFDGELKAHIRRYNGMYYLFIDEYSREEVIEIVAHELIHIQQYDSNDLVYLNGSVFWRGEEYDLTNIEYQKRPWEDEAFEAQSQIASIISNILYK
jgi:hypothetical protein